MNEKKMRFLLTAAFCVLTVLTVNAEATTADDQVCQANELHVCFTKQADGTLAEIMTDGHGLAITNEARCSDTEVAVYYGCQPVATIRAEEREECDDVRGWYWCPRCNGGSGRCLESEPREDDSPAPPPQTPPAPPIVVITPPAPPGPGVTTPPGGGSILPPVAPVPPGPAATCPDCMNAPDPCTDIPALAEELAPLEQIPADQWLVRTDTDYVRSRVLYIRERAGTCAEDGLFAATERILAAMTPPPVTVPLLPDNPRYADGDEGEEGTWCEENPVACGFLIAGVIFAGAAAATAIAICAEGGCDPTIDVYNNP